ncbi:hypothetical protein BO70DRAFT_8549 [Aspergillus heteromorphus CBS 117.55]|uniref:Uncharacterized protein n=1 Tax=Aspergillus heteromorphus CBS 117.55 TaxID=1448321 RepID=A0A317X451_9EURO|nr:uncharacterized protein BO70DRAFT_8549 [Aspergillus heteromorphus CBS 117.55]PWY92382.1 hypothetical protein BO70DRAFT_8549 [Aspergillus heteromorphus CBS 117.55]
MLPVRPPAYYTHILRPVDRHTDASPVRDPDTTPPSRLNIPLLHHRSLSPDRYRYPTEPQPTKWRGIRSSRRNSSPSRHGSCASSSVSLPLLSLPSPIPSLLDRRLRKLKLRTRAHTHTHTQTHTERGSD